MAQFYFHVRSEDRSLDDETGEPHDSVETAKLRAQQIARELSEEPETYSGCWVTVTNEGGLTVAYIPVPDHSKRAKH